MKVTKSVLKNIIRESIENVLMENTPLTNFEMERMWAKYGNDNVNDRNGKASMAAMSDDPELSNIAINDKGEGCFDKYVAEASNGCNEIMRYNDIVRLYKENKYSFISSFAKECFDEDYNFMNDAKRPPKYWEKETVNFIKQEMKGLSWNVKPTLENAIQAMGEVFCSIYFEDN